MHSPPSPPHTATSRLRRDHTGDFAGIQPTARMVKVPDSAVYDLRDHHICALRIYFPMRLLIEQLTS